MVETEERKIKERQDAAHEQEEKDRKEGKIPHVKKKTTTTKTEQQHDDGDDDKGDNQKKGNEKGDGEGKK